MMLLRKEPNIRLNKTLFIWVVSNKRKRIAGLKAANALKLQKFNSIYALVQCLSVYLIYKKNGFNILSNNLNRVILFNNNYFKI